MSLYYAIALLVLFYFLLVIEFIVPSGGLLGAAAVATLVAAVSIAFAHSWAAGLTVLLISLGSTPAILYAMVKLWPHTPIGRRILNIRPGEDRPTITPKTTADGTPLQELVGRIGEAKTDLLPSGLVSIDGKKLDAISKGMPIDRGMPVIVTHIELGKIHVRAAQESDRTEASEVSPGSPSSLESMDLD